MASIWIDKKYTELMSEIAPREGSEDEHTFTSMAHASCFAAALAYNQGKSFDKKLKINRGSEIRDTVLGNKEFTDQMNMLAMAVTESHEILDHKSDDLKDQRYEILENFTNQGLGILLKLREKSPTDVTGINVVTQILHDQSAENVGGESKSELGSPDF